MLVETKEGRRISGKRHLCDAYLRGTLLPVGNDVEYDVDPSIVALQQRQTSTPSTLLQHQLLQQQQQQHVQRSSSQSPAVDLNEFVTNGIGSGVVINGDNPLKRPSSGNSFASAVPLPTKQSRLHNLASPTQRRRDQHQQHSLQQQHSQQRHPSTSQTDDAEIKVEQNEELFKVEPCIPPQPSSSSTTALDANAVAVDASPEINAATASTLIPLRTSHPESSVNSRVVDDEVLRDDESDGAEIIEEAPATTTTALATTTMMMNGVVEATNGVLVPTSDLAMLDGNASAAAMLEAYQSNMPFLIPLDFAKKLEVRCWFWFAYSSSLVTVGLLK